MSPEAARAKTAVAEPPYSYGYVDLVGKARGRSCERLRLRNSNEIDQSTQGLGFDHESDSLPLTYSTSRMMASAFR